MRVRQTTRFPDAPSTRLEITCAKPVRLSLHVRRPIWAGNNFAVHVNGRPAENARILPGYFTITRTWKQGDTVEVALPMSLYTQGFRDNPNRLALLYGPLVLCAETTDANSTAFIVGSAAEDVAALKADPARPLEFTAPSSVFRTQFDDKGEGVRFRPFFREYRRPYVVYWDVIDQAGWRQRKAERDEQLARERELDARTVDRVAIGEPASEREHNLQGERTGSGPFGDRIWRHATDGGWFSYDLRLEPGSEAELVVTYWGSDAGARAFDVLVNGTPVGTETLANNAPGKLFDRTYALPPAAVAGTDRVTVRFQARPGNFAGGVFGLRAVRKGSPSAKEPAARP